MISDSKYPGPGAAPEGLCPGGRVRLQVTLGWV